MFVGDKSSRDIKSVMPIVEYVKSEHQKLASISNDELRESANVLRKDIADYIKVEQDQIAKIIGDVKEKEEEELKIQFI